VPPLSNFKLWAAILGTCNTNFTEICHTHSSMFQIVQAISFNMKVINFRRFLAVIEIIIKNTFHSLTQYGATWMRISLGVIWAKIQARAYIHTHTHTHYLILIGFYFIIIIKHSATFGRYILLWCDIMTQLRISLPVITLWSHALIDFAFVKFI
jgi:hypothetical protein